MKHLLISTILFLSPICFAQQVEIATTIAPEDLGAYKWLFTATAEKGNVVVFRVSTVREWPDGKVTTEVYDSVHYSPDKKQTASAFFINPDYFHNKEEEPNWHFQALGGTGWIAGKYADHSCGENKGEITFESEKWGKTKKVFETFVTSYEEASVLYDELPSISSNGGWRWAGSPKTQSEQDAALNADKPRD